MAVRALTFDAAGTLIAPHPGVGAVYAEVAARHGIERDAAELDRAFAPAFTAVLATWPAPYGADEADARRFWDQVIAATFAEALPYELCCDLYDAFAQAARWRVLPGARAALALAARRHLPCAVVSNFDLRLAGLIAQLDLGPFTAVVTSAQVGRAKPDPAPLVRACALMGVAPAEVIHVGDHEREDGGLCAASGATWLRVDPAIGIDLARLEALIGR